MLRQIEQALALDEVESREFRESARLSQKTRVVPDSTSIAEYQLLDMIWQDFGSLTQDQIDGILLFLRVFVFGD